VLAGSVAAHVECMDVYMTSYLHSAFDCVLASLCIYVRVSCGVKQTDRFDFGPDQNPAEFIRVCLQQYIKSRTRMCIECHGAITDSHTRSQAIFI
jgi:hypothetical protein